MTPQQAATAAKADYTQNGAAYNSGGTPMLGVKPNTYSYTPDGSGGYSFYQNGNTPISREQYTSLSGNPYPTDSGSGSSVLGASTSTGAGAATPAATGIGSPTWVAAQKAALDIQHQGVGANADAATTTAGSSLHNSILDLLSSLKTGQKNIDTASINNDLAKQQGTQSVLDMVGNGIRSGGVILDNKNASDSSAAQALAQAYGLSGRQELAKVGNQFEQGQNSIANQQSTFNQGEQDSMRHIQADKAQKINDIVSTAQASLTALDSAMAGATLPDRIDIQKEADGVRAKAIAALQQYDQELSSTTGSVTPMSADQARAQASTLAQAGTPPSDTFNFTTQTPSNLQGTGPVASNLPLFTLPNSKKVTA